jgi:hypothetical protein
MKVKELLNESVRGKIDLVDALEKFLPFVTNELQLPTLPKISLIDKVPEDEQPTFGRYSPDDSSIVLAVLNRHPVDILRTFAHELVHYKQDTENRLNPHSGETGSNEENEANGQAGIIMRNFAKQYPEFFSIDKIYLAQSK